MDDEQAALLSRKGYLVVSADYSLAPRHRFPTAIHEIEKTIHAVLADSSLPLDANGPLVVGGFSAGAVMSLSLAQLPSLRDRITAVVAFQPLTDWTREHRGPLRTTAWGEKDVLTYTQGLFAWAYIPAGQDMRDPLLSVLYADRTTLKAPVFIITSEMDCIADEAVVMAARLAGRTTERLDYTQGWEEGGVRYKCVRDMPHSFEHFWVVPKGEEWVGRRKEAIRDVWEQVTGWLDGVVEGTR
jgi:acetyl esterase/lipase